MAAGGDSFAEHTLVNGDNVNPDQNNPEEIVIAQNDNQEASEEVAMNVEDEFAVDNDIGAPDLPDVSHIFSKLWYLKVR